jgi:hypothetical protein
MRQKQGSTTGISYADFQPKINLGDSKILWLGRTVVHLMRKAIARTTIV